MGLGLTGEIIRMLDYDRLWHDVIFGDQVATAAAAGSRVWPSETGQLRATAEAYGRALRSIVPLHPRRRDGICETCGAAGPRRDATYPCAHLRIIARYVGIQNIHRFD